MLRVLKVGGRVVQAKGMQGWLGLFLDFRGNKVGPLRVWMKDKDVPGLAMTRSFGDEVGRAAGVISDPGY